MRSLAMSIFLYAYETWTIERRIQALKMRCFRKLLGISYRDHITNEEVKARIGNAIGPYEDLLTSVLRRKLKWYGHITRSSELTKTVLQGTAQGRRRRLPCSECKRLYPSASHRPTVKCFPSGLWPHLSKCEA